MHFTRKHLIIGLVVLLVLAIVALVACSPRGQKDVKQDKGNITLTYWRLFDDSESFQPLIDQYQKEHPNVKIEYKKLEAKDYEKQLVDAFASNRAPDLFTIHDDWLPRYLDKLAAAPTDKVKAEDVKRDYFQVVSDTVIKDDKVYALPYSIDPMAMFVNSSLLSSADVSEPPKTWADLTGQANDPGKPGMLRNLVKRNGATITQAGLAAGTGKVVRSADILSMMMLQQRVPMVNEQRDRATFNLSQRLADGREEHLGKVALDFYSSFGQPNNSNYSWNDSLGDSMRAFAEGKVVLMLGYPYQVPAIERINAELNYDVVPVPQVTVDADPVTFAGFWGEVVSNRSPNQEEAWDFIRFVAEKESIQEWTSVNDKVPALKEVEPSGKLAAFHKEAVNANTWYKGDNQQADEAFLTMINEVLRGTPSQNALDTASDRVTKALQSVKDRQPQ